MARPQQRFRGVRQRHWGSWVSEIRHPLLKTRIWLGTFETAEEAATAYDEAARLMCGHRARTNFAYNPNASQSSKLLSATLAAKLHKSYMASLQLMSKPSNATAIAIAAAGNNANGMKAAAAAAGVAPPQQNSNWALKKVDHEVKPTQQQQFNPLEDHHIDQMIEELLDHGSIELCTTSTVVSPHRSQPL